MLSSFYRFFTLIIVFSSVISCWTTIALLSNTTFNLEIKAVINDMYLNQKSFIINVKDLSLLLLKDANNRLNNNNLQLGTEKNIVNEEEVLISSFD